MFRRNLFIGFVFLSLGALLTLSCAELPPASPEPIGPKPPSVRSVTVLQEIGGRVGWSHAGDKIAFDRLGADGYFDVYTINPDGSSLQCLTCNKGDQLPQAHNGNPAWHPSGEYIVFQSEDPKLQGFPEAPRLEKYVASPGVGINNNIWLMTADGSKFWQLTQVPDHYGALHPHFSPDGKKLLWSEIISPRMDRMGHWAIKLADFAIKDNKPQILNIETLQPLNLQLYEMHGFSPDGQKILFSGVENGKYYYDFEIYVMDLASKHVTRLTADDEWDEHAHFSPDGHYIVWTSSEGIPQTKVSSLTEMIEKPPKLEYWIMKSDGSSKKRISGFNQPGEPDYIPVEGGIGLGDFDWAPDGKTIVAKMRRGRGQEVTVLIEFDLDDYLSRIQTEP